MKIITISREFGSGGRELGKRLADLMGFDYYDSEIITAIAKNSGMDAEYLEKKLANHGWQSFPITYRGTLGSAAYVQSGSVAFLLEQKKVIEEIAALGKDFVIVGRNADVILSAHKPLSIFVCAETDAKVRRCMERKSAEEELSEKELVRKMRQIDKMRSQIRAIMTGSEWGKRGSYHLTVNTTDWDIGDLTPAVAAFADRWFGRK
ncbi:MAG: cytidylate kinase-like family protein [Oscillospiraceae bacterium]|nr:cytidylate kinase-like family protein [Oscillospiraceae bacterium]